jgi:poly(hydroxyalkanoate) synthase III subunit E
MADNPSQQLFDLWKKQLEEGSQAWLKMMGQGAPVDPQAFWRPFMDQGMAAWSKVMTQGAPPPPDLMAQWKQFLDQWIAAWSRVLEQAMSTETFAQAMGKQLEGFLGAAGPVKKAAEQQVEAALSALGVPSRSQVVGLAWQLVQLEEKVDGLEERLDEILSRLNGLGSSVRTERV